MSTGLSPNDIRNYEFSNQMRGYDKDEVREFLEQAAVTLENLKQENLKLSMQADSLKSQLESVKQFETAIKDAAIDARKNADQTIANAKKQAEEILAKAQQEMEESVGNREAKIKQIQDQLTKLEMTRTSYLTKLRDMIDSHRELVDDVANMKAPEIPAMPQPTTPPPSAKAPTPATAPAAATAAAAVAPLPDPTPAEPPTPKPQPPLPQTMESTQAETDFSFLAPDAHGDDDPMNNTSNGIEVEESSEMTRHTLETIGTSAQPEEPDRTEEANAPSRIVAVEADQPPAPKPDSPLDPELAAALENYQAAHADTPELNQAPPSEPQVTTARAEDIPPEFIPAGDDTAKTTAAQISEEASTDKIKTANGEEDATEHNAIDIDQPMGQPKQNPDGSPAPEEIAQELDAVAAKFEEEMDKAARS